MTNPTTELSISQKLNILKDVAIKIGIATDSADTTQLELEQHPSAIFIISPSNNSEVIRLNQAQEMLVVTGLNQDELNENIRSLIVLSYLINPKNPTFLPKQISDMTDKETNGFPLVFSNVDCTEFDREEVKKVRPYPLMEYLKTHDIEIRDYLFNLTSPTSDLTFFDPKFPEHIKKIKNLLSKHNITLPLF